MPLGRAPDGYVAPTPPAALPIGTIAVNPAAPLSPVQPSTNPLANALIGFAPSVVANSATSLVGQQGMEITWVALFVNGVVGYFKRRSWFREDIWAAPFMWVVSSAVALLVWWLIVGDLHKAVINIFGVIGNAHVNYQSSKVSGVGIFPPTAPEHKWATTHPAPDPSQIVIAQR